MRHQVFASEQRYGTFGQVYLGVPADFPVIAFWSGLFMRRSIVIFW
jgi:hypothetical protein